MVFSLVFPCFGIFLALNNATANYTNITNKIVDEVYTAAGYKSSDYVKRCVAEGNAIHRALKYLHKIDTESFEGRRGIEFIFASTRGHACSYIYGKAKRLADPELAYNEKPSKIIVVYTLNYYTGARGQEYLDFIQALQWLIHAGRQHKPQIEVVVKHFRPVQNRDLKLVEEYDYIGNADVTMEQRDVEVQLDEIDALHSAVNVNSLEIIGEDEFKELLTNTNITTIVSAILGCEPNPVSVNNQIYMAIPMAQIRIMATAILQRRNSGENAKVVCLDNPSGMNETGFWKITKKFRYPVDIILSYVWHKELVNTTGLLGDPKALVLDIIYNNIRLIDELRKILSKDPATNKSVLEDVDKAIASSLGVFTFAPDSRVSSKMVVV